MKKALSILSLGILAASVATGIAISNNKSAKEAKADTLEYRTYIPVREGWIENTDGSGETTINAATRARNDRFWNGNGDVNNWDSQERTFNAMDEFIDTIHRANGGEGWRGAYRTPELTLHDNDHRYISFLFGGGADGAEGEIFANVYQITGAAGSGNRIVHINTSFDGSGYFNNEGLNPNRLNAPISCNMVFKYFELPNEIQPGDKFLIYVRDGKTGSYGGFTFGDVHINQTLADVAKSFSAHKQQMKLNEFTSDWNRVANEYVLNYYATDAFYASVRAAEAALDNADDGFENNGLSNWAYDKQFSGVDLNFQGMVSDNDAKNWTERMPANKSDNLYLNADVSGVAEDAKYRFVSHEFTLSGTGFISAKLGGGTAVMSLIDAEGNELVTSRIAEATGTNILNSAFLDASVANVMTSGARLNTMSRTYLDASAHLGKKVRVILSDDRTGGNWGLAYFDEVVTKYTTVPTFKVDRIEQQFNDTPLYHGVVTDKYVGSAATTFGQAYAFVQRYYSVMRSGANGQSWCSALQSQDVQDLLTDYAALNSDVKALVDAAQDYDFGTGATSENWYLTEANLNYTIGQSMAYAGNMPNNGAPNDSRLIGFHSSTVMGVEIALISSIVVIALAIYVFLRQKRRKVRK